MTNHSDNNENGLLQRNPFVVETPEKLAPSEIVALFVEQFTHIEAIKQRKHTFTWGSRGSGKSMMARYLEPKCQQIVYGDATSAFSLPDPFLAVYCPCKEGHLNRTELALLDRSSSLIISEHALNILVADRVMQCIKDQFPVGFFDSLSLSIFVERAAKLFDRASIATAFAAADDAVSQKSDPVDWFQEVLNGETRSIARYLRNMSFRRDTAKYEGATSGYHDFLLPFMRLVSALPPLKSASVYVLLDDADRLTEDQQSIVNQWVANRDHSTLCLKISARRDHYRTMHTLSGSLLEQPHDYTEIDVDELYTRSTSDYHEKVKLISNRRLQMANMQEQDISVFLPEDCGEVALRERIRTETAQEWSVVGEPGRKADFVHRYTIPRLFQHLRTTKQRKSYAGFDNLVDLSSGIIRDFLEPCYLMFDKVLSTGVDRDAIREIPSKVQDEVIYKYSESFLVAKIEEIREQLPPEKWDLVSSLRTLIESLGRLFYEKLHDRSAREARLFSFTLRGSPSPSTQETLALGLRHRYFSLRTYSSKEGGGREPWYILNRRLCPVYKLDPSGFEGRISLTPEMLDLACTDSDSFVRERLRRQPANKTLTLFEEKDDADATDN